MHFQILVQNDQDRPINDIAFNGTKSQFICFGSEWHKEKNAELLLGAGMQPRVKELKWLGIYFGVLVSTKIVMHEKQKKR